MPHIDELSMNKDIEGNNGDKYRVTNAWGDREEMNITISRIKVEEELIGKK